MPIAFNCPSCQKKLTVKDELAGKVAKCPCGTKLKIPSPQRGPAQQPAPAPQPAQQPAPAPQPAPVQQPAAQAPLGQLGQAPQATAGSAFDSAFAGVPTGAPGAGDPLMGGQDPAMPMPGMPGQMPQVTTPQAPAQPMQAPENLQNINPDFKVQCIQCGQQYPMRPDLFGQTVACQCGAPIRFDDPLGSGGTMINQDPLGLGAAMAAAPVDSGSQPLAYQSVSQPQQSQRESKAREEEVLKMYIKDEEEYEKATKPVKRRPAGGVGGAVSGLAGGGPAPELNFGMVFTGIAIIGGLIALGVCMMIWPNAMGDYSWTQAEGFNEFLIIILWGFYTGIALCVIGGALAITACIIPGKIFFALQQATASHEEDE